MFKSSHRKTAVSLAILTALVGCIPFVTTAQCSRYSLTLVNTSGYTIDEIYLSSSELDVWGQDLLGNRTLPSGSRFTITDIEPGEYDVKLVDQDGDSCKMRRQNVFRNLSWGVSESWLLSCEFRGR